MKLSEKLGTTGTLEHHVVGEFMLGRPVDYPNEHMHHKDGDKKNNLCENLELKAAPEHNSEHMLGELNPMYGIWDGRNPLFGKDVSGSNNPSWRDDIDTDKVVDLRESGMTYRQIAKEIGCSPFTVGRRLAIAKNHRVISVSPAGKATVYNGTVDDTHTYFVMCGEDDAILSANCGEQPLEDFEACNLGSINIANFYLDSDSIVDNDRLDLVIENAVRMLDDVVSASVFPLPAITEKVLENRKIGLGMMGLADLLVLHHIPYGSDEAVEIAAELMEYLNVKAHQYSTHLANERGNFPAHEDSIYLVPKRNAAITTIAPTGTISMLANGTSSGIEPVFAFAYTKKVMDGKKFNYIHPAVQILVEQGRVSYSDLDYLLEHGSFDPESGILEEYPYLVGAMDVSPVDHVRMQAAIQASTDNAVSKTINLPNSATRDEVDAIYRLAYETGCKGTTIYRDGSKSDQVLFTGSKSENVKTYTEADMKPEDLVMIVDKDSGDFEMIVDMLDNPDRYELVPADEYKELVVGCRSCSNSGEVRERPEVLLGLTARGETPCGYVYVTISEDEEGQPFEVFCKLGKSGACAGAVQETMGRLVSQELRSGGDLDRIIKQLRGASCGQHVGFGPNRVTSCIDAIGLILQRYSNGVYHNKVLNLEEEEHDAPVDRPVDLPDESNGMDVNDGPEGLSVSRTPIPVKKRNGACPECGSGAFEHEGGCATCRSCGYSKCA
jgi:ribonucleoside-diphosphate reductase alpha chain